MTWTVLFLFTSSSTSLARPLSSLAGDRIFPLKGSHECAREREILWRDDDGPLASTSSSFMPRESDERETEGSEARDPFGRISGRLVFAAACRGPLLLFSRSSYTRTPCRLSHRREIRRPPARCIPMQIILAPRTRRNRRNFMLLRNSTCLSYTLRLYRIRSFSLPWSTWSPSYLIQPRNSITHPRVYPGRLDISSMITKE